MCLAYFDLRPVLYLGGLPVCVGLAVLVARIVRLKMATGWVVAMASLLFTASFVFFLTELGPFIGQKVTRDFQMRWEIKPAQTNGLKEPEVVLHFQDYPGHYLGEHSRELAEHLRGQQEKLVQGRLVITTDYGKTRGIHLSEIAGLSGWKSEWGYSAVSGSPSRAPWD